MSTLSFFERLERRVIEIDSLLCVGLDPHPEHLNQATPQGAWEFCSNIINRTHTYAAAYKPNSAFFESLGPEGMSVLERVCGSVLYMEH